MHTAIVGPSRYSPEEIDRGLLALALAGGNAMRASRELEALGHPVPWRTLYNWRDKHAQRLSELRTEHAPKIEALIVREARDSALLAAQVEQAGLARLQDNIDDIDLKDLSKTVKDASVSKAVNVDQVLKLEGRPTQIVENRQASDLIRKLRASGAMDAIDGEAEEIKP